MKTRPMMVVLPLAAMAACLVGGCSSSSNTASARDEAVRSNPTPELQTLSQRYIDVDNRVALTMDENLRMINQDWGRFWLMDRPSRLTRERIPH